MRKCVEVCVLAMTAICLSYQAFAQTSETEMPSSGALPSNEAEMPAESPILDTVLQNQAERDAAAEKTEALRAQNEAAIDRMRREALAVDLMIAGARDRNARQSCIVAKQAAENVERSIARTRAWLADINGQCNAVEPNTAAQRVCAQHQADAQAELARLLAIDTTLPQECAVDGGDSRPEDGVAGHSEEGE